MVATTDWVAGTATATETARATATAGTATGIVQVRRNPRLLVDTFVVESGASPWHPDERPAASRAGTALRTRSPSSVCSSRRGRLPLPMRARPGRGSEHLALHPASAIRACRDRGGGPAKANELFARYSRRDGRLVIAHNSVGSHRGQTSQGGERRHGGGRRALLGLARVPASSGSTCCASAAVRDASGHPRLIGLTAHASGGIK